MSRQQAWLARVGSRLANRRLIFTLLTLALCGAKGVHLHNNRYSIAPKRMLLFFFSFFTQDVLLLIFIRLLLGHWMPSGPGRRRFLVSAFTTGLIAYNIVLGVISVSFYFVAGSEVHWRNIGVVADPTSRAILLSGLMTLIVVVSLFVFSSWVLQTPCFVLFGWGADLANWPVVYVARTFGIRSSYSQVPQWDGKDGNKDDCGWFKKDDDNLTYDDYEEKPRLLLPSSRPGLSPRFETSEIQLWPMTCQCALKALPYIVVVILLTAQFTLTLLRPADPSLIFLSWTSGLLPFVDFASTSPLLEDLPSVYGTGIQHQWDNITALAEPPHFEWLPKGAAPVGFEDWYMNLTHYNAAADPLRVTNLDEPVLKSLRGKLKDIKVRHVILFMLESTRNDVFPVKKDGLVWNRFAETFPNHELPIDVKEKLASLTPTANFITGDYDDGFPHADKPKRGGVHFTNAHTAGTYTLKSMIGTICGVAPLVGDFNLEFSHHIYQPCLPHIFEAMNKAEAAKATSPKQSNWHSYFFQTATLQYDNHDKLMAAMGFPEKNTIDREYLRSAEARHGAITLPNVNEFAFEEDPLEEYIDDIFNDAKKNDDQVFLTHITSTSHHRFHIPKQEAYTQMAKGLDMMSRYINAEGYDDKWIRKVLNLLDRQGIANETLIIFLGDHGVSLPENDIASPYYNPNVGVDHVPLVISHPQLPAFDSSEAVHSSQVLPTILDMLLETGSLTKTSRQAAMDLLHNYEGQSLLRPLNVVNKKTGQGHWQFTVTNPGRAMLTVRDARYPERHLVVPVIQNVNWRLSNLTADPKEENSVQGGDFKGFLESVEERYGREVAEWAEEGAFATRWFVKENSKRWRFGHN